MLYLLIIGVIEKVSGNVLRVRQNGKGNFNLLSCWLTISGLFYWAKVVFWLIWMVAD